MALFSMGCHMGLLIGGLYHPKPATPLPRWATLLLSWKKVLSNLTSSHLSGVLAIAFKDIIVYAEATKRYVAFLLWSVVTWVVYLLTVWSQFPGSNTVQGSTINPITGSNSTTTSSISPLSSLLSLVPSDLIGGDTSGVGITLAALQSNEAWLVSLSRFLAGIIICSVILLVEKVAMQWIALSFHQTTYSDRIELSNVSL